MTTRVTFICSTKAIRDDLLTQALDMSGVELSTHIGSARALLTILLKERPDVVLLDFPHADEQALEQIEAATLQASGTPVVLVSPDTSLKLLKRAMRAGVRDILPTPITAGTLQRAVDYVKESKSISTRFSGGGGTVLAFMPVKGGSGATFLATNLAETLAVQNKRVLVVDLNLYFGDAALYVTDRIATAHVVDMALQSHRLDATLLAASVLRTQGNVHILPAPDLPNQIDAVTPDALEAIVSLARMEYDFVLLDMSRTLDRLAVKALDLSDRIYMTLQLSLPTIQAVKRLTAVFSGLGYPSSKLSVVVNRFYKGGAFRQEELDRATNMLAKRIVPNSYVAVTESINQGIPMIQLAPRDPVTRALQEWAQELAPVSVKPAKNWFSALRGNPA
ncbi:MAG: AAA family ATPase [Burkholderiales bacterium]